MIDLDALRAAAACRLGPRRLAHVEAVADTVTGIATAGGWDPSVVEAALRAAWIHDACKEEDVAAWVRTIQSVGWEPDPWARVHAPHLLHAQAAAGWAVALGERDPEVLAAVWHHPTAHADWGSVGRLLFIGDFCEPTRGHARMLGTARLRKRAGEGEEGLAEAARRVLALRLEDLLEKDRLIHPESFRAWNAWSREGTP